MRGACGRSPAEPSHRISFLPLIKRLAKPTPKQPKETHIEGIQTLTLQAIAPLITIYHPPKVNQQKDIGRIQT